MVPRDLNRPGLPERSASVNQVPGSATPPAHWVTHSNSKAAQPTINESEIREPYAYDDNYAKDDNKPAQHTPSVKMARVLFTASSNMEDGNVHVQATPSRKKARKPFTGSSDEEDNDGQDDKSVTTLMPLFQHKRRNSDPLERINDGFQISKPIFTSFQTATMNKPNTSVPKRNEAGLVWSFGMGRFMGRQKKNLKAMPSLADADGHAIPPMLPFGSFLPNVVQLPITPKGSSPAPSSSNSKAKATSTLVAEPSMTTTELLQKSFSKLATGSQLATVPEHAALDSEDTPPAKEKREGYGFSYSDSDFISDEVPDTKQRDGYGFSYSDFSSDDPGEEGEVDDGQWELHTEPRNIITPNTSFQDVIVVRDIGSSFSYTAPSALKCTHAKLDDTIRIKHAAKKLLRFAESEKIFHSLSNRLERMMRTEVDIYTAAASKPRWKKRKTEADTDTAADAPEIPSILACALKLRSHLSKVQEDRVTTGECKDFIIHELQWAEWFIEATRVGVFHLKVSGCRCRPEWEELGDEEAMV